MEAPAQKSISLRQHKSSGAFISSTRIKCSFASSIVSQLHVGEGEAVHDLRVHGLDRSLNGRRINRPGEPDIVHAHNVGCRSGRIIQIYVVLIIVYAIAVSIEVSDPRRI